VERRIDILPATPELLAAVAINTREADIAELWAAGRMTPEQALDMGDRFSNALVAVVDGEPICAFGVTPISAATGLGAPWLVGTTRLDRYATMFIRRCRPSLQAVLGDWLNLVNYVDARNARAIRWLSWLGFTIHPTIPYGPFNLPFHPFTLEGHHV